MSVLTIPDPPTFDAIDQALRRARASMDPAEIHGSLCGLLCVLGSPGKAGWLADILAEATGAEGTVDEQRPGAGVVLDDLKAALGALAATTATALEAAAMDFQPLLPADDEALADRVDGLAQWCQGFNHGLFVAARLADAPFGLDSGDTAEIIRDFAELGHAAMVGEPADAGGEAAYAELVEYVRVSVQLVYEEMTAARHRPDAR